MNNNNFLQKLFDFSFKEFVTPSIIKILYALSMVCIAIYFLVTVFSGFSAGGGAGLMSLLLGVVVAALGVIAARVYLEVIMVMFRIMHLLEGIGGGKGLAAAASTPPQGVPTPPPPPEPPVS